MTTYDNFKIRVLTSDNNVELAPKFRKVNNAIQWARYYKDTPSVRELRVYDVFEVFWYWTPQQGEVFMGAFEQALKESRGNFVTSNLKKRIAEAHVPFTVLSVSDWTFNKDMKTTEANLMIKFGVDDQKKYNLSETMTLSISQVMMRDKDSGQLVDTVRNRLVNGLRDDIETEGPKGGVVLTYDASVGRNGWYDLASYDTIDTDELDAHPF